MQAHAAPPPVVQLSDFIASKNMLSIPTYHNHIFDIRSKRSINYLQKIIWMFLD